MVNEFLLGTPEYTESAEWAQSPSMQQVGEYGFVEGGDYAPEFSADVDTQDQPFQMRAESPVDTIWSTVDTQHVPLNFRATVQTDPVSLAFYAILLAAGAVAGGAAVFYSRGR